jgi:biopolymer transport protein TolR
MAFGRLERTPASQPMSDINMTPLIDVMLVLLVIFMLSAPLMVRGVAVDLPALAQAQGLQASTTVAVSVDAVGQVYLDQKAMPDAALVAALRGIASQQPDAEVQLRVDASLPYARLLTVMGLAQQAGLHRIGFVAQKEKDAR